MRGGKCTAKQLFQLYFRGGASKASDFFFFIGRDKKAAVNEAIEIHIILVSREFARCSK